MITIAKTKLGNSIKSAKYGEKFNFTHRKVVIALVSNILFLLFHERSISLLACIM